MFSHEHLRSALAAAIGGAAPGRARADQLCQACVDLLEVDGAAISLMGGWSTLGTLGSSSELSRRCDEYQFTFGEGPCLDSVREAQPILVPDLGDSDEQRWPVYAGAVLDAGVRAVYALPVALSRPYVGALDLFRIGPGQLSEAELAGGLMAARLAALPLLDLMQGEDTASEGDGWEQLDALDQVEVYQATGMIMAQLDVGPAEALVRLRAHAFAQSMTAGELSIKIIRRELRIEADESWHGPTGTVDQA